MGKKSEWEHNLVVYNLKPEQLLINALVIPKGLLSLAVIAVLYLMGGSNSLMFQYLHLISGQVWDHHGFLSYFILLMPLAQSAKRRPWAGFLSYQHMKANSQWWRWVGHLYCILTGVLHHQILKMFSLSSRCHANFWPSLGANEEKALAPEAKHLSGRLKRRTSSSTGANLDVTMLME